MATSDRDDRDADAALRALRALRADAERLAAERPFAGTLDPASLERASGWKAGVRGSYFVTGANGRRFKLRICASPAQARRMGRGLARLGGFAPRVEAREGPYLLIEHLSGHQKLGPASLREHCRGLGRMYAAAHASDARTPRVVARWLRRGVARRTRRRFERELALLHEGGVIDERLHRRIRERFRAGVARQGLAPTFEIRDFHMGNVMVDAKGDLRFVDEAGLGFHPKGLGYAKLLAHVPEERFHRAFREGYAEVLDPAFLAGEQAVFARVVDGVHSVASKLRRGAEPARLARSLEALRRAEAGASEPPDEDVPAEAASGTAGRGVGATGDPR